MAERFQGRRSGGKIYEQRQYPRYVLSSFITWHCQGQSYTGQVIDICMGGIKIKSRYLMPLLGEIQFSTLGAMPFDLTGQVKWVSRMNRNFKFGVQFMSLSRDQVRHLKENCLVNLSLSS